MNKKEQFMEAVPEKPEKPEKRYYLHITMRSVGIARRDEKLSHNEYLVLNGLPDKVQKYSEFKTTTLSMRLEKSELSPEAVAFLTRMRDEFIIEDWRIEEEGKQ